MTGSLLTSGALTIGVDVGGTSVRAGLVDESGRVLDLREVPTPEDEQALEAAIAAVIGDLSKGLVSTRGVGAVGLAVAGFVSLDRRTVQFSPHLSWRGAPVGERIERAVGLPVVLEHDANAAAVAEHRSGAARSARVVVLLALGTGIGGALLIDGVPFRGAYGTAPELGHLRLVPGGRPCPCGKQGCLERYCSGTALVTTALEFLARSGSRGGLARDLAAEPGALSGRRVAAAARDGDPVALEAMADMATWLGEGLALVADLYDPDLVIIGGGVSESAPLFLDAAREHYATVLTGAGHRPLARILTAALGDDAGLVGAALLARSELG